MFQEQTAFFLYAESSIHVGSGQALGAVDLAIQREQHTQFPVVPASGLKGALRHWFERQEDTDQALNTAVFGPDTQNAGDHAGAVAFSDARLMLFPMRSLRGVFAWVTCPAVLQRLRRDWASLGQSAPLGIDEHLLEEREETVLCSSSTTVKDKGQILLDEYAFSPRRSDAVGQLAKYLAENALPDHDAYSYWRKQLRKNVLVVSNETFRDFTLHSTEVQARIKIDKKTGTTSGKDGNLFYQENLPPESLFYALTFAHDDLSGALNGNGSASDLLNHVRTLDGQRLQIGGDASIGKGRTAVHFL